MNIRSDAQINTGCDKSSGTTLDWSFNNNFYSCPLNIIISKQTIFQALSIAFSILPRVFCSQEKYTMEENWSKIIAVHEHGWKRAETLWKVGKENVTRMFVCKTMKWFSKVGTVENRCRSSQLSTVMTAEMMKRFKKRIWRNPKRSLKKLTGQPGISEFLVQTIVKRNTGHRALK